MELAVDIHEGIHRLSFPEGADFDELSAPLVRNLLKEHFEDPTSSEVILNIGGVEFIDSTAVGVIIGGLKRARQMDKAYAVDVTNASESCRRIFSMLGLDKVITLIDERSSTGDGAK